MCKTILNFFSFQTAPQRWRNPRSALFTLLLLIMLGVLTSVPLSAANPEQAFTDLAAQTGYTVQSSRIVDDWALLSLYDAEQRATPALARQQADAWEIALPDDALFATWLDQLPDELIPVSARAYLLPAGPSASHSLDLRLPFPAGQTWRYLAGPSDSPKRRAVDFGPLTLNDPINPHAPFTGRERIVTAAANGVVIERDTNRLVVRHVGGWETVYGSLAQSSIQHRLGQPVAAGEPLGLASNEVAPQFDVRVHFWVRHLGVDQIGAGMLLSGWQVRMDNGYESGDRAGEIVYADRIAKVDCATTAKYRLFYDECLVTHFTQPIVRLTPELTRIPRSTTADTSIELVNGANIQRLELALDYDPVRRLPGSFEPLAEAGDIFQQLSLTPTISVDRPIRTISLSATFDEPFNGSGILLDLTWPDVPFNGQTALTLAEVRLYDENDNLMPTTLQDGVLQVVGHALLPGRIQLQGSLPLSAVSVDVNGQTVSLDENGGFAVEADGPFVVTATAPAHLTAQMSGDVTTLSDLGPIQLLAGDVSGDQFIDVFDLSFVAQHYGQKTPMADLNGDGLVDLFDLVIIANNYGQQGPIDVTP